MDLLFPPFTVDYPAPNSLKTREITVPSPAPASVGHSSPLQPPFTSPQLTLDGSTDSPSTAALPSPRSGSVVSMRASQAYHHVPEATEGPVAKRPKIDGKRWFMLCVEEMREWDHTNGTSLVYP